MVNDIVATEIRRESHVEPEGKDLLGMLRCKDTHILAAFEHFCVAGYLSFFASARSCCRGTGWAPGGGRHDDEPTAINQA